MCTHVISNQKRMCCVQSCRLESTTGLMEVCVLNFPSTAGQRMHLRRLYAGIPLTLIHILVLQNVIRTLICCRDILMLQSRHTDFAVAVQRWRGTTEIWDFTLWQNIILRRQECATPTAIYIIRQIMLIMNLSILSGH